MKDYYEILGLDTDASPDSIKLAYRRLARELHPDRFRHISQEAEADASARMSELNEAYRALSDSLRRKDYDEQLKAAKLPPAVVRIPTPQQQPPPPEPVPVQEPPAPVARRPRTSYSQDVIANVVRQFSEDLLNNLMNNRQTFDWKQVEHEGFDWGVQAGFWLEEYHVMARGFNTADQAAATKFMNYGTLAIQKAHRMFKKNYFLLILPFQRLADGEQVKAACRRFAGGTGAGPLAGVQIQVVLIDVAHGRSLPCGPPVRDKRFASLMERLGFSRPN